MTIIVYRNGECYADDLCWRGERVLGRDLKIAWRKKDGAIVAASGSGAACEKFLKAAMNVRVPKENGTEGEDGVVGFVFMPDGTAREYDGSSYMTLNADYFAVGAGSDVAIGALIMGASAREAVQAVLHANSWASGMHGVGHAGHWEFVDVEEAFKVIHANHVPTHPKR